jgi:hypothetical protein
MSDYRVFQINGADHIVDGHVVSCRSDDEVTAMAPQYLAGYAAVEIWIERRRVARLASMPSEGASAPRPQPATSPYR